MKKKPEVRDFFIGTYPLNAYPDPWDFVVDKCDIRSKGRRLWIKDEISVVGQCGGHDYFLVCAEKR